MNEPTKLTNEQIEQLKKLPHRIWQPVFKTGGDCQLGFIEQHTAKPASPEDIEGVVAALELLPTLIELALKCGELSGEFEIVRAMLGNERTYSEQLKQKLDEALKVKSDREIWLKVWTAFTQASNSTRMSLASDWADECVAEFNKRWPKVS